jgi:hypothetical protein
MKTGSKWGRRLLLICIVGALLGSVGLLTSCKEEPAAGPDNGTITVRLVNAGVEDGELFVFYVFAAGADPAVDDPIGANGDFIGAGTPGTAEAVALDADTGTSQVSFTGGSKYDVYGIVDYNTDTLPTTGEPVGSKLDVEVDGNMLVELDYATFVPYP